MNATITDVAESTTRFTSKLAHLVRCWPGTQKALAAKIGITPQMLSEYIRGAVPKPHVIFRLAEELGVVEHLSWLLDESCEAIEPPADQKAEQIESLVDATPHDLLKHLVTSYLNYAIPLRKKLDELVGCSEIDWVAIWVLSNVLKKEVPEPIRDVASILKGVSVMADGLYFYDFNNALEDEVRRRKLDVTHYELGINFLASDWSELKKNNLGIDALLEYLEVIDAKEIGLPRLPHDPNTHNTRDQEAWLKTRAPYLLARLVSQEKYELDPKVQPLIEALESHGFLDKKGNPTEPEGFSQNFDLGDYFADVISEHHDELDENKH